MPRPINIDVVEEEASFIIFSLLMMNAHLDSIPPETMNESMRVITETTGIRPSWSSAQALKSELSQLTKRTIDIVHRYKLADR